MPRVKKLYRNLGAGRFVDVTPTQPESFRAPRVGRGLAVGDYDNDGFPDALVNNNGESGQLLKNSGARSGHWLGIRLVGRQERSRWHRCKAEVRAGPLLSYDQAKGGLSYSSAQDPRILFGLGPQTKVDVLEILWPSGEQQVFRGLPVNQYITVEEGKGITPQRTPAFRKR